LCDALHYAHTNGIIHRDIKPGNIILLSNNKVKLTDFGIAKFQSLADAPQVTKTGIIVGTPSYMSPEQISGNPIDQRSDIFSLAVVIWELLTGRRAFDADSIATIAFKVVYEELPPADKYNPNVPKELSRVLMKALAKKPEKRYSTVQEFRNDLENLRSADYTLQFKPIDTLQRVWYLKPINIAIIVFILILAVLATYYFIGMRSDYLNIEENKQLSVIDYLEQAHNYVYENKLEEAIKVLQNGELANPKDIKIKKQLAVLKERSGDYQGAMEIYIKLSKEFPSELNYALSIANNWYGGEKRDYAEKLVQELKSLYPDDKNVSNFLEKIENEKRSREAELAMEREKQKKKELQESRREEIAAKPKEERVPEERILADKGLFGFINIRCYPAGEIFVDKLLIGRCPLMGYKLPVGKHTIMLKGANNQIYERNVFIFAGKTEEIYYNFESYAKIFIQCGDNNYKIYIDNNYVGVTPYYNDKIEAGKHTVIIEKANGQRETKYIFLKPNAMETVKCATP